jgi:tRNA (guanine37-N1)-methyltransferase
MVFDIMTLFPDLVSTVLGESVIGRAQKKGAIEINCHNIRDFSKDKHRRVDDTPYGGGKGMLMMAPPIYDCYEYIRTRKNDGESVRTVFMSPSGAIFDQKKAEELSKYDNIIILCGHYEGVDQRVIDEIVDEEISIGNFVLTGGEIPACIVVDAVARLVDGVLSDPECYEKESISSGMLEYPQYTRPFEFHGVQVPEILISGNHAKIDKWRQEQALDATKRKRPDLLEENE